MLTLFSLFQLHVVKKQGLTGHHRAPTPSTPPHRIVISSQYQLIELAAGVAERE